MLPAAEPCCGEQVTSFLAQGLRYPAECLADLVVNLGVAAVIAQAVPPSWC